jgi:vacuolar-type H+-ATPase subunit I/STV1
MEPRNKGFVIVGVVLLVIGLFASFYKVTHTVGQAPAAVIPQISYPYQIVGVILLVAGIIFSALGLILRQKAKQKILSPPSTQS